MSAVRAGLASALLCTTIAAAAAQMELADWYDVPSDYAGLVLVFDQDIAVDSLVVSAPDDGILDEAKWALDAPFVRQYRLESGSYTVRFPEGAGHPINAIGVYLPAGDLSFIEISPYQAGELASGVRITSWTGLPSPEIEAILVGLWRDYSDLMQPTFIAPANNIIELYASPPWRTNGTDDPGPSIDVE